MRPFGVRRRPHPTLERMFVVLLMIGVPLVVRAGEVAAQPAEALSPLDQGSSAEDDLVSLPVTLSNTELSGGMRDDLPPSIRKARPSSSVRADLPGRSQRDCAILRSVEVYRGIGRRAAVAVSPADLQGVTPDGSCPPEE